MFRTRFFFGVSVLILAGGIVVSAQGRGNTQKPSHSTTPAKATAPAPHPASKPSTVRPAKTTQPAPKTQIASSKTPTGKTQTAAAASSKTPKSDKPAAAKSTKPVKSDKAADTKLAKADKPAKNAKSTAASTSSSTSKTATTTTPLTPVQEKLKQNTNLAAKVASRLPPGTDLMTAAAGFKNLGQFVAAANVSNNLQISFTELKAKMMTGMSLGQAIQAVRPLTASPTIEAQRAEYDARGVIAESEQQPTQTASSTPAPTSAPSTPTTQKAKSRTKNPAQ